jgi:hypothetical protein
MVDTAEAALDLPVAFPKKISTDLTLAPTAPNPTTTRDRRVKKKEMFSASF